MQGFLLTPLIWRLPLSCPFLDRSQSLVGLDLAGAIPSLLQSPGHLSWCDLGFQSFGSILVIHWIKPIIRIFHSSTIIFYSSWSLTLTRFSWDTSIHFYYSRKSLSTWCNPHRPSLVYLIHPSISSLSSISSTLHHRGSLQLYDSIIVPFFDPTIAFRFFMIGLPSLSNSFMGVT